LLTLPLPRGVFKCFETKLYVMQKGERVFMHDKDEASSAQIGITPGDIDFEMPEDEMTPEAEASATLINTCMIGKRFFQVLVFSFWIGTVFVSLFIMLFVGERVELEISEDVKYYIELTEEEAL
jgi:hypothetical protein